jgi:2-polyprenyl-3-methyl-5-hydroxy-6-metoxy-1,4-benzoquinol methylase
MDKDNWSQHWVRFSNSASDNPAQLMRHQLIIDEIASSQKKCSLIIDIGSGQGDLLNKLQKLNISDAYIGLEMSESGIEISKSKNKIVTFIQVDIFKDEDLLSNYFNLADYVICSEVIEHVDNPLGFCMRMKRYLKSSGKLILTVPGGPMSTYDKFIGHRIHYTKSQIGALITDAGYVGVNISMSGFPFFNLYRLMVILRGKKLIQDASLSPDAPLQNKFTKIVMNIFRLLFRFNFQDSLFGWQVFLVAQRKG